MSSNIHRTSYFPFSLILHKLLTLVPLLAPLLTIREKMQLVMLRGICKNCEKLMLENLQTVPEHWHWHYVRGLDINRICCSAAVLQTINWHPVAKQKPEFNSTYKYVYMLMSAFFMNSTFPFFWDSSSDPGASVYLWDAGHVAEHPSSENLAQAPFNHQLQQSGRSAGSAGETRVHQRQRAHAAHHHG